MYLREIMKANLPHERVGTKNNTTFYIVKISHWMAVVISILLLEYHQQKYIHQTCGIKHVDTECAGKVTEYNIIYH